MSNGNSGAVRRGAVGLGIGLGALLLAVGCGESRKDTNADPAVAPPKIVTPPMKSNGPTAPPDGTAIEQPKPDPGGQSGSDSGGSTPCAEERRALASDDATPWGSTLAELDAEARELLEQKAVALIWTVASEWKPTALSFVLELDPAGATLGTSSNGCPERVVQAARLHLRSDDGLLDDVLETQLVMSGDESTFYFTLSAELAGEELATSALGVALVERGVATGLSLDDNDDVAVAVSYGRGEQAPVSGSLRLSWFDENGDSIQMIDVASIDGSQPAPSPRVAIEPAPALAGSCAASSRTLPLEPPSVAYDDRLSALAGTWILCGGDRAEPIAIEHVGLVIAEDGRFVQLVQDQGGGLREGTGFAREGKIEINDARMSGLDPSVFIEVRSVIVRELLLSTSEGLLQGGSRRLELSADGMSMRWIVDSGVGQLDLVYRRSELPVSAAPVSSYQAGELAGAAACGGEEHGLQALQSQADWQGAFGGRWTWCSGAPDAATAGTLELDDAGGFRQLNATGQPLIAGSYALVQGIQPGIVYLQLTPDAGAPPWTIFGMRSSEIPRKLLVATAVDGDSYRVGVLSATP
ncbi:MAG TPA: hypothetical protein VK509_21445 [Polyangiales bacterium]|nr:hypothetical protein [Polyangiales bacterium]